ncbi:hypothetical protein NQ315_009193 [Exocentrus adspersus]|uniref:U3 small nucleolar ribonucleoprotein protein MPP10 n=1 Tax=Exocentrus adspersus TaxID=1586481 RepID=A0AAV8WG07_9CUCU|nr:hypothetical protein NQ315_009193 [Exocentrus adspersus]
MKNQTQCLDAILDNFQLLTKKPSNFSNADDVLLQELKCRIKEIYELSKSEEKKINNSSALPALIIKKFDVEQIWQQIELQNESLVSVSITNVSKLVAGKSQLIFDNFKNELENSGEDNENKEESNTNDGSIKQCSSSESEDGVEISEENDEEMGSDVDDKLEVDSAKAPEEIIMENEFSDTAKRSAVDDNFFKLDEMERFLNVEEKRMQGDVQNESDDSDSGVSKDDIDLFKDDSDNSDDDEKVKTAKFKDFFVAKDTKKEKRNKFLEAVESDDPGDVIEKKSSLELREQRLKKKIQEFEENAINEKPWQLKGEIRAEDRPQNSLLEEIVDFDLTSRPAPIITEQTTLQLEDIIKQRIKDKVFDSVERKSKPVDTPLEYKKKLVLDQEKSKHSLAQIYEKEFLEQQATLDPDNANKQEEEPELHKEIKTSMKTLFNKLDALSNFHFTPKPSIPELKIVNNLPAVSMEEVAPNAVSDGALLAPEEVKNKTKGEIIAKGERTATDKKRERRKKKLKQRVHLKEKQKRENIVNKWNPGLGNKYSKQKVKNMLEKVTMERNTEKMDESISSSAVKSSKAFFFTITR